MSRLRFIPPQLPSLTEHPPEGAEWIHEVKHDGYRTMLLVERGTVHAYTRNGHDWSDRYPGIIAAVRKLPCRSAILDGEVIVQDALGVSDFEALQAALRSLPTRLIFYAFDLLHLERRVSVERNLSSNHAPLTTTTTNEPNSTQSLAPSARIISNTERAAPAKNTVLANRKERIWRVTTFPF